MSLIPRFEILRAACCVAGADGVNLHEREILYRIAQTIDVNPAALEELIQQAESDVEFYESQFSMANAAPLETLEFLFSVALVDGDLALEELGILYQLAKRLGVSNDAFQTLSSQAIRAMNSTST